MAQISNVSKLFEKKSLLNGSRNSPDAKNVYQRSILSFFQPPSQQQEGCSLAFDVKLQVSKPRNWARQSWIHSCLHKDQGSCLAQSTQDAGRNACTNSNIFPLMLLACSVDTPIHINRSHLLASRCMLRRCPVWIWPLCVRAHVCLYMCVDGWEGVCVRGVCVCVCLCCVWV